MAQTEPIPSDAERVVIIQQFLDKLLAETRAIQRREAIEEVRAFVNGLGPASEQLLLVHGVRVPLTPTITPHVRSHMRAGTYETPEIEALMRTLRPIDTVLELGTGCGVLATLCAQICGSDSVCTVEADEGMWPTIGAVYAANQVNPLQLFGAVSCTGESRGMRRADDFWATQTSADPSFGNRRVNGIKLGYLLAKRQPSVLVIDIEGGELDLCGELLPDFVRAVIIEVHGPECVVEVSRWLTEQRFKLDPAVVRRLLAALMSEPQRGSCRSCKAPVIWVTMQPSGKAMPLNPHPSSSGNITLNGADARVDTEPGRAKYTSHFATCPNARNHRAAATMMPTLTVRQGEVLRAIKAYMRDRGYAPTQRELCEILDVTSTNSISEHLVRLTKLGVLKRDAVSARAMAITAAGEAWLRANPPAPTPPPTPEAA